MPIVGFNFSKINVEKKSSAKGKISINNNVSMQDVTETELAFGASNHKAVQFHIEYSCHYDPEVAKIQLSGEVVYVDDEKKIKAILADWKKSKKVEKELMANILNNALNRCNIQSLVLSRDMNLPSPIPLPRVGIKQK